jgi:hypothetical protein
MTGNGLLIVPGRDPLAVAYTVEVFADSITAKVVSQESHDVGEFFGRPVTLQLQDGQRWECLVVTRNGRLVARGAGPV